MEDLIMEARAELGLRPGRIFIGGRWMDWDGPRFDQVHPANNRVMTCFADVGERGVDQAVAAARKAFDEGPWPRMPAQDRKRIIQRFIERIYTAEELLAKLQTLDNGIPYTLSLATRVSPKAAADVFDHFAGWIDKINGETYPRFSSTSNMDYMSIREPVGVVGAILAWNAPLIMFALKVGAALACGCTVVVKPSEYANLAVMKMAEILAESELPPGVFNVISGGASTGASLSSHRGVDKISFTGSATTGERILAASGTNMKRLSLELGGKSAAIVFPDVHSIASTANSLMGLCSSFLSGQVCSTPTRALVHRSVFDEFVHHAVLQAQSVKLGDPFDPTTTSAPIISKGQLNRILGYVESGKREGARLVCGGRQPGGTLANGNWMEPALFVDVKREISIFREEIFGPVLCAIPFDREEEAVRMANDSEYGLAGCIYTTDVRRAFRVARAVRSGSIGINGYASVPNAPMGGVKRSGIGREGGWSSIEAFTELKTIDFNMDV
ncbi:aldehyde dehydrogenase family protein [Caballeronia zhejiangensis]|uniref:aldehyde dehydrogenase family protein n=1 Tax=Caballeronia zhejiangensis TaxID=871203 RepID=UPI001EF6A1A3|nr:aldehyde dehydrogenase family protein [Caballeronia zhejiangensis]MCG7400332.1 aldehyde dehydrogenase family protein [Caballeronia zhejiangensis]